MNTRTSFSEGKWFQSGSQEECHFESGQVGWDGVGKQRKKLTFVRQVLCAGYQANFASSSYSAIIASQVALLVKDLPASTGDAKDAGSIPGSGRSPEVGNGNPLQYPCLDNPMDRGTRWAAVHGCKELDMTEQLSTAIITAWLWGSTHRLFSAGDNGLECRSHLPKQLTQDGELCQGRRSAWC